MLRCFFFEGAAEGWPRHVFLVLYLSFVFLVRFAVPPHTPQVRQAAADLAVAAVFGGPQELPSSAACRPARPAAAAAAAAAAATADAAVGGGVLGARLLRDQVAALFQVAGAAAAAPAEPDGGSGAPPWEVSEGLLLVQD